MSVSDQNHTENLIEISVIVPLYKCKETVTELSDRLMQLFLKLNLSYEIILVDDNSPFNDWDEVKKICKENPNVKGVSLSRNFGQHPAIFCGLNNSIGKRVVVMDGDLQDVPEEIEKLYAKAKEGYDIVYAQRKVRKDSFFKRLGSHIFYKILGYLTDTKQDSTIANFGIYSRKVIDAVLSMNDYIKYFPTMSKWPGFKSISVPVRHSKRAEGKSSYTIGKLLSLAFNNIITFSNKPLKLMIKLGFGLVMVSFLLAAFYLIKYFRGKIVVLGYSSLIVSLWFLCGCIISMIGVVGVYIGKVFESVKGRPIYIIDQKINFDE